MSKRVKIFAGIVVLLSVGIYISSRISGKKNDSTSLRGAPLSTSVLPQNIPVANTAAMVNSKGSDFSSLLTSIKSITIDTSIFDNPAYKALRDHPIALGTDTVGRVNPFAPVGSDVAPGGTSMVVVQTLQPGKVTSTTAEFAAQLSFSTTAPVSVVFQYGTSDVFGSASTPIVLTKSGTALQVIKDLQPNTVYYVQAVAVVGSTTTSGNTMSFTTTTPPKKN